MFKYSVHVIQALMQHTSFKRLCNTDRSQHAI